VGDRLDFVFISGSSPDEVNTREASYQRVAAVGAGEPEGLL
jgi:hypothetical protein